MKGGGGGEVEKRGAATKEAVNGRRRSATVAHLAFVWDIRGLFRSEQPSRWMFNT